MQPSFRKVDDFLGKNKKKVTTNTDQHDVKHYCNETFGETLGIAVYKFIREIESNCFTYKNSASKSRLLFLQNIVNIYGGLRVVKGISDCYKIIRKRKEPLDSISMTYLEGVIKNNYKTSEPSDMDWPPFINMESALKFKKQVSEFEQAKSLYEGTEAVTPVSQETSEEFNDVAVVIPIQLESNGAFKSETYKNYRYKCTCGWEMDRPTITCKSCKAIFKWGGYR